jgi:hypothetical protein
VIEGNPFACSGKAWIGLTFVTIFFDASDADLENLEGLCSSSGLLVELLEAGLAIVVTSRLGAKSGAFVNSAHFEVERNKGRVCNMVQDGKQLLLVMTLVHIHGCYARTIFTQVDVEG